MSQPEQRFHAIGQTIPDAIASQMFGKPCHKFGGKAFVCFFRDGMAFKLTDANHAQALGLAGVQPA